MQDTAEHLQRIDMRAPKPTTEEPVESRLRPADWYDLVVEAAADGSWFYDIERDEIHYSPSFLDILELRTDEGRLTARDFMARVHPDDRDRYGQMLGRYLKEGSGFLQTEIRVFNGSGELRWILNRGIARRDSSGRAYCMLGSIVDITRRKQLEDSLRAVALSTGEGAGPDGFFESLVRYLADALGSDFAIVGKLDGDSRDGIRTVAAYADGKTRPNFQYELAGSPCANLVRHERCVYADDVARQFPGDPMLADEGIKGYIGSPLLDAGGNTLGIIAALFRRPVSDVAMAEDLLTIFASRAAAELERQAKVEALRESERRFKDFAEVAADIFWVMDTDLRFTYFNERCYARLGQSPGELLGRTLWELAYPRPSDSDEWRRHRRIFENRAPFRDFVYTLIDGRGEHRHMSISGRPVFNGANGKFEGYRGVATEITNQRRAEAQYRDVFNNATEGIYRSSPEGRLLRANPALVRMHGFETESELIESITDLATQWYVDPEDRARITERLTREGRVENFETQIYRRATGERIWVVENARAAYGDNGTVAYYEGMIHDVTERRRLEAQYRDIFDNVGEGIYRSTPDGRLVQANPALARLQGFETPEELIEAVGDLNTDWYLEPDARAELLRLLQEQGYVDGFEAQVRRLTGTDRIWTSETVRITRDADGSVLYYEGSVRDITAEHKSRELARHRNSVLELIARDAPVADVLKEIAAIAEGQQEDLVVSVFRLQDGRLYSAVAPGPARAYVDAVNGRKPCEVGGAIEAALDGERDVVESRLDEPGAMAGDLFEPMRESGYVAALAAPIHDQEGMVLGVLAAFASRESALAGASSDLLREMAQIASIAIEQHRLSEALRRQAHYDPLTELPNRALLSDRLERSILDASRDGYPVGVLLLDLDEFKVINDCLGHSAGDQVLQEVSRRLRDCLRAGDTVARLGGDEFVLIVPLKSGGESCAEVAGRLVQALQNNVLVDGREVTVRPSIGISLYPQDGQTPEALLQAADTAMYAAKQAGKNQYRYFTSRMDRKVARRLRMETELQDALRDEALELYYQPRIVISTGALCGAEALLRWHHPEDGLLDAEEFVSNAERSPLMDEIDQFVMGEALGRLACWQSTGRNLLLSVNVSSRTLLGKGFAARVARLLAAAGVDPAGLELEVAQSTLTRNYERTRRRLLELKERVPGLRIAVDDFGSGHSSLSRLRQLPIDTLKIDRSFVDDLVGSDSVTAGAIAKTIIEVGHELGLRVVAEGVERAVQVEALQHYGCQEAQGFFYARALPAGEFESRYASFPAN